MNHPVCIFLDSEAATRAAAAARKKGATASIKVAPLASSLPNEGKNLFIVEAGLNERQLVIDAIAEADRYLPGLASSAVRCPNCQSIQIEYPEHPTRSPVLRGLGKVMDWLGRNGGLSDNGRMRCRKCQHVWKPEEAEAARDLTGVAA